MKRFIRFIPALLLTGAVLVGCATTPTATVPTQPAATTAATAAATDMPTTAATAASTSAPTSAPTVEPTAASTSAPTVEPTSAPASDAPVPTPTFAPPTANYPAIAEAARVAVQQSFPDTPVVSAVIAAEGEYAAALASPFGQRPQFVWLKQNGSAWETVFAGATPSSVLLAEAGVPASLMSSSDTYAVLDAWMAQLQNPRGQGLDGIATAEGISGDYARLAFTPTDPSMMDGFSGFWKRENDMWKQIAGGSAYDYEALKQLGIPDELLGS